MKLLDLVLEFSVSGLAAARDALDVLERSTQKVQSVLLLATASATGFVTAGLAASVMGQTLTLQMERLALTVAGLVGPELQKGIQLLARFTDWLQQLSAAEREMAARLIEGAAAFAALLPFIGPIGAAIGGLVVSTDAGRDALGGLFAAARPLLSALMELGKALNPVFQVLGQVVVRLAQALRPLLDALAQVGLKIGESLGRVMESVAPIVLGMVDHLGQLLDAAGPLVSALGEVAGALAEVFSETIAMNVELFAALGELGLELGKLVIPILTEAMKGLAFILREVAAALRQVTTFFRELLGLPAYQPPELKKPEEGRGPLAHRTGGFEGVEETYRRIARASVAVGVGRSTGQQTVDQLEKANGALSGILFGIQNIRPAVV